MKKKLLKQMLKIHKSSRYFDSFHVAGFTYYDGVDVFGELKIGTKLELEAEFLNPHDDCAVAIYYKDVKLGYVPREKNELLHKFLIFGHKDIFDVSINRISPEKHTEHQIGVLVQIKDMDKKSYKI